MVISFSKNYHIDFNLISYFDFNFIKFHLSNPGLCIRKKTWSDMKKIISYSDHIEVLFLNKSLFC